MTPELIKQRFSFLVGERSTAEERWDAIERFIAPYRGEFFKTNDSEQSVELDKNEIFDGTALQAAQTLASNLHGNLTSAYVKWFGLRFRGDELNDDPDAREWLEAVSDAIWLELQESNFSGEIAENYLDLTTFATTFTFEEPKVYDNSQEWDGITFAAMPLKECYFEEGPDGKISHFYRLLKYTPLQLAEKFGLANLPQEIQQEATGPTAVSRKEDVIFCVYPQKLGARRVLELKKKPPKRRPFQCKYVLSRDCTVLKENGYYEMPVFVTRWAKVCESKFGHGPSHVAIYDVQTLNKQEELTMQALSKTIDPPQKATERGVIGDVDLRPGGLTILRNIDDIKPMTTGTEWNVVGMERDNRRAMIREYYMISRLELKDSPAMTATEVERRWQQMQKLLGPTLGRLQGDLLGPIIETSFAMLWRAGRLPQMPASIANAMSNLDIEYTGPLPIAQKSDIALAIEREIGLATNLVEAWGPEALDPIDISKAVYEHARLTAVPAKILRSSAEIAKVKKDRQAKEAMAQKAAQAQQGATAMRDAGAGMKSLSEAGMLPEGSLEEMPTGGTA